MQIFIGRQGQQHGPHTIEQVNQFLAAGLLKPDDLAWYEGQPTWIPIAAVPGIGVSHSTGAAPAFVQPAAGNTAPQPYTTVSNGANRRGSIVKGIAIGGAALVAIVLVTALYRWSTTVDCDDDDVVRVLTDVIYKSEQQRTAISRSIYLAAATSTNQRLQGMAPGLALVAALDTTGDAFRKAVTIDLNAITTVSGHGSAHRCQALIQSHVNNPDPEIGRLSFDGGLVKYTVRVADDGRHFTVQFAN